MKYAIKTATLLSIPALLASCGSIDGNNDGLGSASSNSATTLPQGSVSDMPVRLGSPFVVGNVTYTPSDPVSYDEVGYASYYGSELAGRPTANGEIFVAGGITAAHKTLPMPSYVEVTALDTGRTIVVRVNDRGPFANDRLIDLSQGAAQQLGISSQGVAGVRVRRVNPPEQEKAMLRSGTPAPMRIDTPESLLKVLRDKLAKQPRPIGAAAPIVRNAVPPSNSTPSGNSPAANNGGDRFIREGNGSGNKPKPGIKPTAPTTGPAVVKVVEGNGYVVQIGSFSNRSKAEQLARKVGAHVEASPDGRLYRVRFGPFGTEADAATEASRMKQRGYSQATVLRN